MVAQVSGKAGIRFAAFSQMQAAIATAGSLSKSQVNFLAGIGAGIIEAAVWVTPTERLKVLKQAELESAKTGGAAVSSGGFFQNVASLYSKQGVPGFFVGLVPTAARQGIAMGIRFALYEEVKVLFDSSLWSEKTGIVGKLTGSSDTVPKSIKLLLAGMTTGVVSSLVNQPIDTAKSRIQEH
eukprot:gnl/TRDRNA2_/TRDRNA2_164386_c0_seq2.p1 gnl/TRDRNA2_/TRDRNA2_164386_c0~~gnl/TRDRNA2_/TRDRNA2_164386_c0_seq2.p1  ORF type:complete len:204 (+),score=29.13 gnl/TRDRNA2_/TRDRNA2_164386_c0_seq2:68-613(+)